MQVATGGGCGCSCHQNRTLWRSRQCISCGGGLVGESDVLCRCKKVAHTYPEDARNSLQRERLATGGQSLVLNAQAKSTQSTQYSEPWLCVVFHGNYTCSVCFVSICRACKPTRRAERAVQVCSGHEPDLSSFSCIDRKPISHTERVVRLPISPNVVMKLLPISIRRRRVSRAKGVYSCCVFCLLFR